MARKKNSPWLVGILIWKSNHLPDFYEDFNQTTENTKDRWYFVQTEVDFAYLSVYSADVLYKYKFWKIPV